MVDLLNGVLQLAIKHGPVRHDDHGVKDCLAVVMAQLGQVVRRPGNGRCLARSRTVFAQISMSGAFLFRVRDHLVDRVVLVKAREDQRFLYRPIALQVHHILLLDIDEAVEDPQEGIGLADFFPEIGNRVFAVVSWRVAAFAVMATVEGQEVGVLARQFRRHPDFTVGHREMHDGPAFEGQQRVFAAGGWVFG